MSEKQPFSKSKPSKMEQVFVGTWNAVKPEGQAKTILEVYDALKFPKFTKEEKKVADKVHVFLKNNPKLVGWGAIATEAAVATLVIAKGYKKLKESKQQSLQIDSSYIAASQGDLAPLEDDSGSFRPLVLDGVTQLIPGTIADWGRGALVEWPNGEKSITREIGQLLNLWERVPAPNGAVEEAGWVLNNAIKALDPDGIKNDESRVTTIGACLGALLSDGAHTGKMEQIALYLPTSNTIWTKVPESEAIHAFRGLQELFAEYFGWSDRLAPSVFKYWAGTLLFAGLHMLLPDKYPKVSGDHLSAIDSGIAESMRRLSRVYKQTEN